MCTLTGDTTTTGNILNKPDETVIAYWINSIPNQRSINRLRAVEVCPALQARLFAGLSLKTTAYFYGTTNSLWLFAIACLNLYLEPHLPHLSAPPSMLTHPQEHPSCLNQGCAPLQRVTVTSFLQFRCDAKTHHLKLVASDLLRVYYCRD